MKKLMAKLAAFVFVMAVSVGISITAASAAEYKFTDSLQGQVIYSDTYLGTGDYFTVVTGGNTMQVDQTYRREYVYDKTLPEGSRITQLPVEDAFEFRLKTTGTGNKTRRAVSFTTATDNATLTIYAVNGSGAPENAQRSMTVEGPSGFTAVEGLCQGSNTELYNGRNVGVARKETVDLGPAGTYYIYSPDGSFSIYELIVEDGDDPVQYWAPASPATPSTTTAYPSDSDGFVYHITNAKNLNDVRDFNAQFNVQNHNGVTNSERIRLGEAAYPNIDTADATIENNGFITFDYADEDAAGFKIRVVAASSGSDTTRDVYLGTYEDGEFTEIGVGTAVGNTGTNLVFDIPAGGSTDTITYAVYVKPREVNGELKPAQNTDIKNIEILLYGDYYTTPYLTLDAPVVEGNALTVTGRFNDFSGNAFEISDIWIEATSPQETPEAAKWKGPNPVVYLNEEGGGVVSFKAYFVDESKNDTIPETSVKLQAHATYGTPEDGADDFAPYIPPTEIISNAVKYTK